MLTLRETQQQNLADSVARPHIANDRVVPLQGPLSELAPQLASYVKPGGKIMLSGILSTQWPALRHAYEQCFTDWEVTADGSWALVLGTRT